MWVAFRTAPNLRRLSMPVRKGFAMRTLANGQVVSDKPRSSTEHAAQVPLVKADAALLLCVHPDTTSAGTVGEVIDNSLEAGANIIRVRTFTSKKKIGTNTKAIEVIERVAMGDDGCGMPKESLHQGTSDGLLVAVRLPARDGPFRRRC